MFSRILPLSRHNYNIERVKFGVTLDQVCGSGNQIPGPLLVLILKLNKEAPFKKDVFRAPGHQANMKKLIHFLQTGRLVNIDKFSVYTIASVLKKFLRKIPGGIFGPEVESQLFDIIRKDNIDEKREEIHRLIVSLPKVNQQLLVLLFGTFRAIACSSEKAVTGMTSEAIGVSVAPSFFQSCVSDGSKIAKMEDVHRFKVATTIMKFLIDNFGVSNLFGRENYDYYAKITGRMFKVEENWIFVFKYPPDNLIPPISSSEECQSTPTLYPTTSGVTTSVISRGGEHGSHAAATLVDEAYARLSMSLEENVFKVTTPKSPSSPIAAANNGSSSSGHSSSITSPQHPCLHDQRQQQQQQHQHHRQHLIQQHVTDNAGGCCGYYYGVGGGGVEPSDEAINLDELKIVNRYAESTKSLSFLPMVHERQTQRMKTRSEWFLTNEPQPPSLSVSPSPAMMVTATTTTTTTATTTTSPSGKSASTQQQKPIVRRTSSKEKRLVRRSSSKKDKENGNKSVSNTPSGGSVVMGPSGMVEMVSPVGGGVSGGGPEMGVTGVSSSGPVEPMNVCNITESDCTEMDVQSVHMTLTYKPRI